MDNINPQIHESWKNALIGEFEKEYFKNIKYFLIEEKKRHKVYPPGKEIFNAYNLTPLNKVKVVIIGQDPYHDEHQAHGLCFSVRKGVKHPPSLINIFKELQNDIGIEYPLSGDLTNWSKQGVFLLNASLTVRAHQANSHQNIGWQKFTDATIKVISKNCSGIVFLLWGGFAKKKSGLIDVNKHTVLTSGHPSPLSANRGYWFGNKHFSKTNEILIKQNQLPIDWSL